MTRERPKHYKKRGNPIEAMQVTMDNYEDVSNWVGGRVMSDGASDLAVMVPTVDGVIPVHLTEYVCREFDTNRFFGMDETEFNRLYEQTGLRGA